MAQPEFFKGMSERIGAQSLDALKSYLRWHALHNAAPWLSQPFDQENYNFYQATLSGQKEQTPRWKRCTRLTDTTGRSSGPGLGEQELSSRRQGEHGQAGGGAGYGSLAGHQAAGVDERRDQEAGEEKLAQIRNKIGYPEKWRDYSSVVVKRDDLLGNVHRAADFERKRNIDKLGKPVDEKEWSMTPPTVNAYYSPSMNDINFPAGILQPPFFDEFRKIRR